MYEMEGTLMAVICAICGKKQSGFIMDFPMTEELNGFRICATCDNTRNSLLNSAGDGNDEVYAQSYEYFNNILNQQKLSDETQKYLEELTKLSRSGYEHKIKGIRETEEAERKYNETIENFMMTTGFNFEGYIISRYNKVICAETVLGTGFLSEISAGIADLFGSENESYANKLGKARESAIHKLILKAMDLNANAVIGLDFDYTVFSGNIISVMVNGTAVTVEKIA
jgi:uncharacterized protein YbjQ (UPF0145 family)